MDKLLELLQANSSRSAEELATALGTTANDVTARIAAAEAAGVVLGYQAVVDRSKVENRGVTALIEVKISPEQGGGFDRLARRISQYPQVHDCFLMSGDYDLAVVVYGADLYEVATFVEREAQHAAWGAFDGDAVPVEELQAGGVHCRFWRAGRTPARGSLTTPSP